MVHRAKKNHGDNVRLAVSLKLEPSLIDQIKKLARNLDVSQSLMIAELLRLGMKHFKHEGFRR